MKTDDINSIISANLIRIRHARRYAQKDVARVLAMSQPSYCRIEKGDTDITCKQLYLLALFFKTSITEFYKRPRTKKTKKKESAVLKAHSMEEIYEE